MHTTDEIMVNARFFNQIIHIVYSNAQVIRFKAQSIFFECTVESHPFLNSHQAMLNEAVFNGKHTLVNIFVEYFLIKKIIY